MPFLDVTEVLMDPEIGEEFFVVRRAETVTSGGMSSVATKKFHAIGTITMAGSDLERTSDMDTQPRGITVVTSFALSGVAPGRKPDIILWSPAGSTGRGNAYEVISLEPYSNYGPGFVEAVCAAIDYVDENAETVANA